MKSAAVFPPSASTSNQASILVVDDSPNQLLAIEALLAPLGQRVVTAASGGEALRLLLGMDCAVVLVDVHLPDIDGFEVVRLMREREKTCRTPVIFLSGLTADTRFTSRAYALGAVDFLSKPFDPLVLRAKTEVFVELYLHRERLKLQAEREATEVALRQREAEFRSLAENIPDLVARFDRQHRVLYVNRVVERSIGQPAASIMGRSLVELGIPPERVGSWAATIAEAFQGRETSLAFDFHAAGESRSFEARLVPERDERGEVRSVLAVARDVTEARQREQVLRESESRFRLMAEASELLSSLEDRTVLQKLAELVVPRLADWAAVDLLSETGAVERVVAVHSEPEMAELAFEFARRWPIDPASHGGIGQVLRTGEPLLLEALPEEDMRRLARSEEHLRLARALGLGSSMALPLMARGRVLGALTLVQSESGRRFGQKDLLLAQELARRAGLAVDNALLYREAREAQARASQLQAVAAALSRAATPEEVARAILTEGLAHAVTHAGAVYLREPDGGLRALHDVGYPEEAIRTLRYIPPGERTPQSDTVLAGESRWFTSAEELLALYPQLSGVMWAYEARVGLPLLVDGITQGCLWLSFQGKRSFSPEERNFLTALAQLCSQALERARLFTEAR